MQYIPLFDFFGFLGREVQPVQEKQALETELETLYRSGKSIHVQGKPVSLDAARSFLQVLAHPAIVVFDQWVLQSSGIRDLLLNHHLAENNFDQKLIYEHRLFPGFSDFISPFLLPRLMEKLQVKEEKDFLLAATYLSLLNSDGELIVQDKLAAWLHERTSEALENARKARTEKILAQEIAPLVSDEMTAFVNQFTKSFYATKIAYIASILEVMRFPACTSRVGSWLAGQLKKLELNPEHVEKISAIRGTVKEGKVNFSNQHGKVFASVNSLKTAGWITSAVLFAAVIYIFWFDPFQSMETHSKTAELQTSFEQFTKEERMQIDSLIQSMSPGQEVQQEQYGDDQYLHLSPVEMESVYREPFVNQQAEQFHADCLKDEALMQIGLIDSCVPYAGSQAGKKNYPGFKPLGAKSGHQSMFLQNESVYQVLVVVFSDEASSPVFSSVINAGEKTSFRMNPSDVIMFLPGNEWAAFHSSTTVPSALPSQNYKHHFCVQDENFRAMLFSPYRLKKTTQKTVKLLLNESSQAGTDFFLLDLYEALEAY